MLVLSANDEEIFFILPDESPDDLVIRVCRDEDVSIVSLHLITITVAMLVVVAIIRFLQKVGSNKIKMKSERPECIELDEVADAVLFSRCESV